MFILRNYLIIFGYVDLEVKENLNAFSYFFVNLLSCVVSWFILLSLEFFVSFN